MFQLFCFAFFFPLSIILICASWEITLLTNHKSTPSEYGCVLNQSFCPQKSWLPQVEPQRQCLAHISAKSRRLPGCDTFCRLSFALPGRHSAWQTAWAKVRSLRSTISPPAPIRHLAVWRGAKDQQLSGILFTPVLTSSSALKPWEITGRRTGLKLVKKNL